MANQHHGSPPRKKARAEGCIASGDHDDPICVDSGSKSQEETASLRSRRDTVKAELTAEELEYKVEGAEKSRLNAEELFKSAQRDIESAEADKESAHDLVEFMESNIRNLQTVKNRIESKGEQPAQLGSCIQNSLRITLSFVAKSWHYGEDVSESELQRWLSNARRSINETDAAVKRHARKKKAAAKPVLKKHTASRDKWQKMLDDLNTASTAEAPPPGDVGQ